jgi:hypothetical protein
LLQALQQRRYVRAERSLGRVADRVASIPQVEWGTDTASTGVFEPVSDVSLFLDGFAKLRADLTIRCGALNVPLVLPVTSVELRRAAGAAGGQLTIARSAVKYVRVGLARPFLPPDMDVSMAPRCYAMLVGVVQDNRLL